MRPYTPKLGSTVEQSLAHLATLAPGAEITHMKLAERMGVAPSTIKLTLEAAVKHGCIVARDGAEGSKIVWYSLPTNGKHSNGKHSNGAGTPQFAPSEAAPARPTSKGTTTPKDGGSPPEIEIGTELGVTYPRVKPAAAPSPLRCALWSDGSLEILRTAEQREPITFSREETRALVAYLDAISVEGIA